MYYINDDIQMYITVDENKSGYYISDWRKAGEEPRTTVIGLTGKKLIKWIDSNGYRKMLEYEIAKYLLIK